MKFNFFKKRDNKSRAAKLQELREKRLRAEGKARLVKKEQGEKERIAKAKDTIRQDSPVYKAREKLKTNFNKKKGKGMKLGGGGSLRLGGKPGGAFTLGGRGKPPKP